VFANGGTGSVATTSAANTSPAASALGISTGACREQNDSTNWRTSSNGVMQETVSALPYAPTTENPSWRATDACLLSNVRKFMSSELNLLATAT
jgi:hypothetical protein